MTRRRAYELQGDLEHFPPTLLFQMMALGGATGLLTLRSATGGCEVYFQNGRLVFARDANRKESLGDELTRRGLDRTHAAEAASRMEESSHLFRKLRYEADLRAAGDLLGRIADTELSALDHMERAWPEVRAMR